MKINLYEQCLATSALSHVTALICNHVMKLNVHLEGVIAKWLQRQIRNLFLFEGAGSNPADVGLLSCAV
jgi:hypothetical protein